jgi:hypothetical protein
MCIKKVKFNRSIESQSDGYNKTDSNPGGTQIKEITMMVDLDSKENYLTFLEHVKELGMIKIRYHYMLVTLAIHEIDLNNFKQSGLNITGFSIVDYKNLNTIALFSNALQLNVQFNKNPTISVRD